MRATTVAQPQPTPDWAPPSGTMDTESGGPLSASAGSAAAPLDNTQRDQIFRQLVDAHQKRLYRFILKNVGNATDAEDLAQQAFAEAVRSFVSFRGESELSTWLYGIAMNLVRNFLSRSPHRLYQFESDESLADTTLDNKTPVDQVEADQVLVRLQHELDGLPPEMRDVLMLVAVEDLSYEEAATMLSIPIGTVRSRVARARAALRTRLGKIGITFDF